jgi:hypothetical protein
MASRVSSQHPRELRRRVVLPARMRTESSWCDACILNISSRGMMIHVGRGAPQGDMIELRRGHHVIVARVVWRNGSRAGLHSDDRLPVDEILSLSQAPALQLTAAGAFAERRRQPRREHERSRWRGRLFEFASVAVVGGSFAVTIFSLVEEALAKAMDAIRAALGG